METVLPLGVTSTCPQCDEHDNARNTEIELDDSSQKLRLFLLSASLDTNLDFVAKSSSTNTCNDLTAKLKDQESNCVANDMTMLIAILRGMTNQIEVLYLSPCSQELRYLAGEEGKWTVALESLEGFFFTAPRCL